MINDGYGDALSPHESEQQALSANEVLAPYRRWLYAMAHQMSPLYAGVDDLAQEGFIAMWRSMGVYDPSKGSLPSWLTTAARMRMTDVVRRGGSFGRPEQRGVVRVEDHAKITPVESMSPVEIEALSLFTAFWLDEGIGMAYHRGMIHQALQGLSHDQQRYIVMRFWEGLSNPEIQPLVEGNVQHLWRTARQSLREALTELKEAA